MSVVAGDTKIGALSAAFASHDPFTIIDPDGNERIVSLVEPPTCFRGVINIPGRKKPLKHLVAISQEMIGSGGQDRLLLIGDEPRFVWSSLVLHFGLPALPEWADWFLSELRSRKRMQSLMGLGYKGIAVKTNPQELLKLIEKGLRNKELVFPTRNGAAGQPFNSLALHVNLTSLPTLGP